MSVADYIKTPFAELPIEEILRSPVDVLQGVPAAARAALEAVNVRTVFDLGASRLFATATALTAAESDPATIEARINTAARDAVNPTEGVPANEWARRPLTVLVEIDQATSDALEAALSVENVRDLALWPPYLAAKAIVKEAVGDSSPNQDPAVPVDLLPKSGVYPTERVFYSKLLIDLVPQNLQGVTALEQAGAVDLEASLASPTAFQKIALGALVTFKQSWYSEGVTLGQLLHCLTLAPGESTRIALMDWSRQVSASVSEQIDEREQLSNTQTHNRALSEVTNATASEFQTGSATTEVESRSRQRGSALGVEIGPLALGKSGGSGSSRTTSTSASSSFGARDLSASLAQNISDRTQQNASSSRSRRASIVSEVSQSEHESITTRVVANYNHMHALNVQYFELVQAYRVTTELDRVDRCLFVPLKLLNFRDPTLVARLRTTLSRAALTSTAFRQLTSEYGAVEIIPKTPRIFPGHINVADVLDNPLLSRGIAEPAGSSARGRRVSAAARDAVAAGDAVLRATAADRSAATDDPARAPETAPDDTLLSINERFARAPASAPIALAATKGWDLQQVAHLGSVAAVLPLRRDSDSVFVPDDAMLLSIRLRDGQGSEFQVFKRDGTKLTAQESTPTSFVLATPTAFMDLQSIALLSAVDREVKTTLALSFSVNKAVVTLDVPVQFLSRTTRTDPQPLLSFGPVEPSPELLEHLETNRLHYSQAIYAELDAATIAGILSQFTYRSLPLVQVVDPRPIAMTANFLVFRMNVPMRDDDADPRFAAERADFKKFLADRGLDKAKAVAVSEIVPLPTGGVFAEAVLGRFNSAEKIDLTRFWNWQDSPIPIAAPEIAPLSAGSRAEADDVTPGQLGTPVVTLQTPTALPAAAGVAPMLSAIQTANLFRDMSGMVQTAALAQAAVATSGAGATSAADQAAKNLFTVMDQNTQRMRIAADLIGSMYGAKGGADSSGQGKGAPTATERGGQINAAEGLGQAAAQSEASASGAGSAAGSGGTAGVATPSASLEARTLGQQTGSGVAEIADRLIEAATTPDSGTTARAAKPKPTPKTDSGPAVPTGGGTIVGLGGLGSMSGNPRPPVKRDYRLVVYFDETEGARITGKASMRVAHAIMFGGSTLLEGESLHGGPMFGSFSYAPSLFSALRLDIVASATSAGGELKGKKTLQIASAATIALFNLEVRVRPVVRKKTFKVPMLSFPSMGPDMDNLNQQLDASGVPTVMRVGDPDFSFAEGGFNAEVTYFTGDLLINQIL